MSLPVRLLFDLDETIYMGDVIKIAVQQLKEELPNIAHEFNYYSAENAEDYGFSNFPPVLRERLIKLFSDPFYACLNKYALPGIFPFLHYVCYKKFWKIGYVTSRPANLEEYTNYVLYRDFPGITWEGRYFSNKANVTSPRVRKIDCIKDFKPTHFFDDHWDYCLEAVEAKVPNVFLVTNSHTGWNHKYIENGLYRSYNIIPIKSILELDLR